LRGLNNEEYEQEPTQATQRKPKRKPSSEQISAEDWEAARAAKRAREKTEIKTRYDLLAVKFADRYAEAAKVYQARKKQPASAYQKLLDEAF